MGVLRFEDGSGIQVPDGATPEQIEAILTERKRQQDLADIGERARVSYSALPASKRAMLGYTRPFVEVGLGVKDLAGKAGIGDGLTFEDQAKLVQLEQVHGGAGTAARIGGELVTFAAPGGASRKLTTDAPRIIKTVADIGTSAGVEALKAPTESTSRSDRALGGAIGAGVGHTIAAAARPVLTGIKATAPGAREMLDQGIPLTPGMMKGGVLQAVEQRLSTVPLLGGSIRARQREAIEAWNRQMLNKVMPEGAVTAAGRKGMQEATDAFKQSYEKLWANDVPFDLKTMHDDWGQLVTHSNRVLPKQAAKDLQDDLVRLFQDVVSTTRSGKALPGQTVSQLDDVLRGKLTAAMRNGDTTTAALYSIARERMRAQLPAEMNQELSRIDKLYAQWSVIRRAGASAGAARAGGVFSPAALQAASRGLDRTAGKGATARGQGVLQPEATQAASVLGTGQRPPDFLGGAAMAPFAAASTLTHNAPVNRLITGQTSPQQAMRQVSMNPRMRALIDALRDHAGPGQVGAAVEEQ